MANRHTGTLANSISYLGLSRQTVDLEATFLGTPPPPHNFASSAASSSCRLAAIRLRQPAAIFHVPISSPITKKDGKYNGLKEFR